VANNHFSVVDKCPVAVDLITITAANMRDTTVAIS
jgi:hypothetical protein